MAVIQEPVIYGVERIRAYAIAFDSDGPKANITLSFDGEGSTVRLNVYLPGASADYAARLAAAINAVPVEPVAAVLSEAA